MRIGGEEETTGHSVHCRGARAERSLKCPFCERSVRGRDALVEHMRSHAATHLHPFRVLRCPVCGRLMENKAGLLSHLARSHAVSLRPEEMKEVPFEIEAAAVPAAASHQPLPPHAPFAKSAHPKAPASRISKGNAGPGAESGSTWEATPPHPPRPPPRSPPIGTTSSAPTAPP